MGQARLRLTALEEELNSNRQSLDSAAADLSAAQQELELSQQQAVSAAGALAELEQQQEQSRVAILEAVAAISDLRNQLTQAEERMAAADREARRLQAEMASARAQAETLAASVASWRLNLNPSRNEFQPCHKKLRKLRDFLNPQTAAGSRVQESSRRLARGVRYRAGQAKLARSRHCRAWLFH